MSGDLSQIGVVHSAVVDRGRMPPQGIAAEIEVFPAYAAGLARIEDNTHLWVLGWFTGVDREQLQVERPGYDPARRQRGVFGLRSTVRPNSLSLSVVRLLGRDGPTLRVDQLDLLDGTAVIDIKRYSPSWDSVFSARSSRDLRPIGRVDPGDLAEWEREAANFHGEVCAGVVLGARLLGHVCPVWGIAPKDPALRVTVSSDLALLHLADALQGLTAATLGSGRLQVSAEPRLNITYGSHRLTAELLAVDGMSLAELRRMEIERLFRLTWR